MTEVHICNNISSEVKSVSLVVFLFFHYRAENGVLGNALKDADGMFWLRVAACDSVHVSCVDQSQP